MFAKKAKQFLVCRTKNQFVLKGHLSHNAFSVFHVADTVRLHVVTLQPDLNTVER